MNKVYIISPYAMNNQTHRQQEPALRAPPTPTFCCIFAVYFWRLQNMQKTVALKFITSLMKCFKLRPENL